MEEIKVIITDIKTGLATISGYHPKSYSTQLLISGVNKDVDNLITNHKAVIENHVKNNRKICAENNVLHERINNLENIKIGGVCSCSLKQVIIKAQRKIIDSMKCCGNCKHYEESQCQLDEEPESFIGSYICDDWEDRLNEV